jgi:hypothetical protein
MYGQPWKWKQYISPSGHTLPDQLLAIECIRRFEVFTTMKIQDEVFWVVTPCHDVVGYQVSEKLATSIFRVK